MNEDDIIRERLLGAVEKLGLVLPSPLDKLVFCFTPAVLGGLLVWGLLLGLVEGSEPFSVAPLLLAGTFFVYIFYTIWQAISRGN